MGAQLRFHSPTHKDYVRSKQGREQDQARQVALSAAEPGVRKRFICSACVYRWISTTAVLNCPKCRRQTVVERT